MTEKPDSMSGFSLAVSISIMMLPNIKDYTMIPNAAEAKSKSYNSVISSIEKAISEAIERGYVAAFCRVPYIHYDRVLAQLTALGYDIKRAHEASPFYGMEGIRIVIRWGHC